MKCSKCGGKTRVEDVVHIPSGEIYRQRGCTKCGRSFYTKEIVATFDETMSREWIENHRFYNKKKGGNLR